MFIFEFLILRNISGEALLIPHTAQSVHPHDGALAVLQTGSVRHRNSGNTVQCAGGTHGGLGPVVRPEVEGGTAAGGEDGLLVFPAQTVRPPLLSLTVSHRLAQSYKLPAHPDILDVSQTVVTLSGQMERDGI